MKLNFKGTVKLREDYENPKEARYFAVLDGYLKGSTAMKVEDMPVPNSKTRL